MWMIILSILKIIGIILLVLLCLALLIILLVLFVPIRYRMEASKEAEGEQQIHAVVEATWLLHLLNIRFRYPEKAYIHARLAWITLFRSDQQKKNESESESDTKQTKPTSKEENPAVADKKTDMLSEFESESMADSTSESVLIIDTTLEVKRGAESDSDSDLNSVSDSEEPPENTSKLKLLTEKVIWCARQIWKLVKNIRYTIQSFYDKIRKIVKRFRYYYKIIRSDLFRRAWEKCSGEVMRLLKSIAPQSIKGALHIGMEDPATTGQILGYYGILYPIIGGSIDVVPDFDQTICEGDIKIRGHITLFRVVKTACVMYFNKDIRRVIRLFKREVS